MPLPTTRVIHPRWAQHHRSSVEGAFTATVAIRRPGGTPGAFDTETGQSNSVPYPAHYQGTARIQAMSTRAQQQLAAEQEVTTTAYLVQVEWDAATGETDFTQGDVVDVLNVDANGDTTLPGRNLTVESVIRGSLALQRDLICTD